MLAKKTSLLAAAFLIATPALAMAHPGHGAEGGFGQGLIHPLTGLDHLLAIVAVALLAVRLGGRSVGALPTAFIACCGIGGVIARSGMALPLVEVMIAASVLACGVMLVRRDTAPMFAVVLLPLFGLFHGYAHIAEIGSATALGSYSAGLLVTSIVLTGVTIGVGTTVGRFRSADAFRGLCRVAGTGFAAAAMFMLFV